MSRRETTRDRFSRIIESSQVDRLLDVRLGATRSIGRSFRRRVCGGGGGGGGGGDGGRGWKNNRRGTESYPYWITKEQS